MRRHLVILGLAFLVMIVAYGFEAALPRISGVYVGVIELLLELAALTALIRHRRDSAWSPWQLRLICGFLGFVFIADLFYCYFYYYLKIGHPTLVVTLLTSLPYKLCYLSLFGFFLLSLRPNARKHLRSFVTPLPFLILTPIAARLALPLFTTVANGEAFKWIEASSLFSSYLVFVVALIAFLSAREVFWAQLSSGVLIFMLSDWAIKVEKFLGHPVEFIDYEFLWGLGIALTCMTLVLEKPKRAFLDGYDYRSIALNSRLVSFMLAFASILLVLISQHEVQLVRLVTVSATLGVLGSAILAQLHFDQLNFFTSSIAKLLQSEPSTTPTAAAQLPRELLDSFNAVRRIERDRTRFEIARQVAHDIRSPIAALEAATWSLNEVPEDVRTLLRGAANRIKDIANSLQANAPERALVRPAGAAQLLSSELDGVLSEKRLQYRSRSDIIIELEHQPGSYGLFSSIELDHFKRLMSNLVDNAVDALNEGGQIVVCAFATRGDEIQVSVRDNGVGIPKELLASLGQAGFTYNKTNGSGLGLYHARTTINRWNGRFWIESQPGLGTRVNFTVPRSPAPSWFISGLEIPSRSLVVVLDDDPAIHQVWELNLARLSFTDEARPRFLHFTTGEEFESWALAHGPVGRDVLILSDHELKGERTGLDLIERLELASRSILVTSWFEDPRVQARCAARGIGLIPKVSAAHVPIAAKPEAEIGLRKQASESDASALAEDPGPEGARIS